MRTDVASGSSQPRSGIRNISFYFWLHHQGTRLRNTKHARHQIRPALLLSLDVERLERSNGGREQIHDGGVHLGTSRTARGLLNAAGRYCRGARVGLEIVWGQTLSCNLSSTRLLFPLCSTCDTPEFLLLPDVGFARAQNSRTIVSNSNALVLLEDCIEVEHTTWQSVLLVGGRR